MAPIAALGYDSRMSAGRPAYVVMASAGCDHGDWNRAYTATGKAIAYDPSNGTVSNGDIWRATLFADSTLFRKEFDMEYY